MKKLLALTLALVMAVCMFAACDGNNSETNPPATNPPATTDPEPTEPDVIVAGSLSNHENGWEVEAWNPDAAGVYFNMWTNDLPYNSDWTVEYQPHSGDVVKLIRDGETHMIGGPGIGQLVKFSANSYYLKFDKYVTQELFPLQEGDVVIIEGDFSNPENGYTIHFDKTYVQLKVGGITKFTTTAPRVLLSKSNCARKRYSG